MERLTALVEREETLATYDGEDQVISAYDMHARLKGEKKPQWALKSGLPALDGYIDGFLGGEVSVISGVTGEGKTTFCQTLTNNFYAKNQAVVWFSYEVRPRLFLNQFGPVLPDFYLPAKLRDRSIPWIRERVHEAVLKYGVKAVFVDHLHYLLDMAKAQNVSLQIGDLMRNIVNMSHELDIHFFLVAHMTKVRPDAEPSKGDARDSSFVEQEADNVFYIWRSKKFDNQSTLKIAKNRRMGTFDKKISLIKSGSFLHEVERDNDD